MRNRTRVSKAVRQWLEDEEYRIAEDLRGLPMDDIDDDGELLPANLGSGLDEISYGLDRILAGRVIARGGG